MSGQLRGLEKMVDEEKYCVDIINQSLAIKRALSSFEHLMLEHHLSTHVADQMKSGRTERATKEILDIYKLSKKL